MDPQPTPDLLSVAPMMEWTDRYYRLYTEMVVDSTILHSDNLPRYLDYAENEHPVALQVGGSDPESLAKAMDVVNKWNYDEVDLNVGCPSSRVQHNCFGALLMKTPDLVRQCIDSMKRRSKATVTVKCRLGADEVDSYEQLTEFVKTVATTGVKHFIIHARKCILNGLNPKENRNIPPLKYDWVYRLAIDFPELNISLNGGVRTLDEAERILSLRKVPQPYTIRKGEYWSTAGSSSEIWKRKKQLQGDKKRRRVDKEKKEKKPSKDERVAMWESRRKSESELKEELKDICCRVPEAEQAVADVDITSLPRRQRRAVLRQLEAKGRSGGGGDSSQSRPGEEERKRETVTQEEIEKAKELKRKRKEMEAAKAREEAEEEYEGYALSQWYMNCERVGSLANCVPLRGSTSSIESPASAETKGHDDTEADSMEEPSLGSEMEEEAAAAMQYSSWFAPGPLQPETYGQNLIYSVMIGRGAYQTPWILSDADRRIFGQKNPGLSRAEVVAEYIDYAEDLMDREPGRHKVTLMVKPMLGFFNGVKGCNSYKRSLMSIYEKKDKSFREGFEEGLGHIPSEVLEERPPTTL